MTTSANSNTLLSAGEYLILANTDPYTGVEKIIGVQETVSDSGTGTILKKEFRYSVDSTTFSEFQEVTLKNLEDIGSFENLWLQFRYVLMTGGPVTISKVTVEYTKTPVDPGANYEPPSPQNENKIYAYPILYRSNFLWEPYKMNRAVRLYKDLNLMVNNLFGHDVTYYRALPQGRSTDVFLMEYSLYEHDEGRCLKVVVPDNQFPDNKMSMGIFGPDFEMPFEVQIDKDYFQKIFGDGSGPQKRDVIHFPRTGRIYEVSSSYLFRDFMNEPLYFKITLIKWLPKTNVEQIESLDTLEEQSNSVTRLFSDLIEEDKRKTTNPEQFNVARVNDDPVRMTVDLEQQFSEEKVLNYHTVISEFNYDMDSLLESPYLKVKIDDVEFTKDKTYYVRTYSYSNPDEQYKYSVKKLVYTGNDDDGSRIFKYSAGGSQNESQFFTSDIFRSDSVFSIYENEYDGATATPVASCERDYANFYRKKNVIYKAKGDFPSNEDRAFSCWFRLKENTSKKVNVSSFNFDMYSREVTLSLEKDLQIFVGDNVTLKRTAASQFYIFGKVVRIVSRNSFVLEVDEEVYNYVKTNFSTWEQYVDLTAQRSLSRVFLTSLYNDQGIKIELFENRHFRVTMNTSVYYFSFPNSNAALENNKWYGLFVNFSNLFKQLTLNVWKIQWNSATDLPATTDLQLIYNKTAVMTRTDRSSSLHYYLNPSYMDLTNVRLFNKVAETDKQPLILNQNVVKDAHLAIIIDNALPQSRLPLIGYTR